MQQNAHGIPCLLLRFYSRVEMIQGRRSTSFTDYSAVEISNEAENKIGEDPGTI